MIKYLSGYKNLSSGSTTYGGIFHLKNDGIYNIQTRWLRCGIAGSVYIGGTLSVTISKADGVSLVDSPELIYNFKNGGINNINIDTLSLTFTAPIHSQAIFQPVSLIINPGFCLFSQVDITFVSAPLSNFNLFYVLEYDVLNPFEQ